MMNFNTFSKDRCEKGEDPDPDPWDQIITDPDPENCLCHIHPDYFPDMDLLHTVIFKFTGMKTVDIFSSSYEADIF